MHKQVYLTACMISFLLIEIEIIPWMFNYRKAHLSKSVTSEINPVSLLMFQPDSVSVLLSSAEAMKA